jgi:MFS family permease
MSLGYGVVQLDLTIVNTALNAIGTSLGGGVAELQWVVSAYTVAFAAFILTAGALGDRIGPSASSWRALRCSRRHRSAAQWRPMPRS